MAKVDSAGIVYAGTVTFGMDMTYSSSTMTSGSAKLLLPLSCLQAINPAAASVRCPMLGLLAPLILPKDSPVAGIACTDAAGMTATCDCQLTFKPDMHMTSGTYTVEGSTLTQTATGSNTPVVSDFCGMGSHLSIRGQPPTAPMAGAMLDLSAVQLGTVILGK
jgi:hypothetical protein